MLSFLTIQGTPYDVGLALGRFGADAVHKHLLHTEAWENVMRWRNSAPVAAMRQLVQAHFPAYWQELEGMAAGLDLDPDEVFLWNCRGDLYAMSPDGCTTVQLPHSAPDQSAVLAHNEDGDPGFSGRCAIAQIRIDGGGSYTSFVYPGSLPGHTFAVNQYGVAMTVNNLRILHTSPGLPRMVLARAMLDQPDLSSALDVLQHSPRSGGFHFTLAQSGHDALVSVEFCAAVCSVQTIRHPSVHANHMVHAAHRDQPQIVTGSSGHRQIRGEEMLAASAARGARIHPLAILFDQHNVRFPIYRNARNDSDNENTIATAVMQVNAQAVDWQIHVGQSRQPLYRLRNNSLC